MDPDRSREKLQKIKKHDKPMDRRDKEKKEKEENEVSAKVVVARMPEEEIAVYRRAVAMDYESILYKEKHAKFFPGGLAEMTAINDCLRRSFKRFKEHSARRLAEYEANGYLEYCPPSAKRLKHDQSKL